ncbi:CD63 antigen [Halyomorpha halys]|uniref:CD63 antigen n=1 Tax=Halyomorpha halys TaxID=286706 RepID=UPI0006D5262C|nr:CD63 antigen [Halyomorpha halys]
MLLVSEGTGIRCIKFSIIFFSIILVITGMSLIIIGTTINSIYEEFSTFLATVFFSPATLLVSVGFTIFGVACLGCLGAIKESSFLIMTFGTLLGMISILQLCAGLSNNILMSTIDVEIVHNLNKTLFSYTKNKESQIVFDNLQQELHCCGMSGPRDWQIIYNNSSVLKSCCAFEEYDSCRSTFNIGCHFILKTIVMESSKILTISAFLLAFTQVFGMLFSFYLGKMLKAQKLAREYRRWAIRSQLLNTVAYDPYCFDIKEPQYQLGKQQYLS